MRVCITGASRGIGAAIAEAFAAQGHELFLTARDETRLRAFQQTLAQRYPQASLRVRAGDMSEGRAALAPLLSVLSTWDTLDVLVNNAGIFLPATIENAEEGALEQLLYTNFLSAYYLTRALTDKMRRAPKAYIFNICSVAALRAYKGGGLYSMTKFALRGLSENLREELKDTNIKVTSVYPGAVWTDSWKGSGFTAAQMMPAEDIAQMLCQITQLSARTAVESIVFRPQKGDL